MKLLRNSEKSQFMMPGPMIFAAPGGAERAVRRPGIRGRVEPPSMVGSSTSCSTLKSRFGRQQFPILAVSSPAETVNGNPDASVTTDVTFQPPTTLPRLPRR